MANSKLRIFSLFLFLFIFSFFPFALKADSEEDLIIPVFDGHSAFSILYKQVQMGPRIPGSDGHQRAFDAYLDWFKQCEGLVREQHFNTSLSREKGDTIETFSTKGTNIIAHFGSTKFPTKYILAAHYDSRLNIKNEPDGISSPGANDNASGVAVLMEMARLFAITPPPVPIEIVLFDLSLQGVEGKSESYNLGSSYFAKNHLGRIPAGVLTLHGVGASDLHLEMEGLCWNHSRDFVEEIFDIAEEEKNPVFYKEVGPSVLSDHIPFLRIGFNVCSLYDSRYPYYGSDKDVAAACSPESLKGVGDILVKLVYEDLFKFLEQKKG